MRKIAILAVALALLTGGASLHMASAQATQHSTNKSADSTAQNVKHVEQVAVTQPAETVAPAPAAPVETNVTIQAGDTLSGIAADHDTTYMRLYNANDFINDPDLIFPGDQVRIPASDEQIGDRALPVVPAPVQVVSEAVSAETAVDPAPAAAAAVEPAAVAEAAPAPVEAPAAVEAAAPVADPTPAPVAAPAAVEAAPVATSYSVSDNSAKAFIYAHESGNNPNATNELGCYGLGQDCNGIVRNLCGADYACQDEFFTNYAMSRYGSWDNALAFWQTHRWW